MATVKLWTDTEAEAHPKVKAVFDDIRATRKSDFVNNFWRGLANQPEVLERTWNTLKAVMGAPGPLDPLTRELIYIAVSITNNCSYCIHSHTAAARAKGMTDAQYSDFLAVVGMASQTNALVTGLQLPVDSDFLIESCLDLAPIGLLGPRFRVHRLCLSFVRSPPCGVLWETVRHPTAIFSMSSAGVTPSFLRSPLMSSQGRSAPLQSRYCRGATFLCR